MGEISKIAWTDATFNPWIGCTKVSAGCQFCYAEALDKRWGGEHWGKGAERRVTSDHYWNDPLRWNRAAEKDGRRRRVFCASLADVFDQEVPQAWRDRLWELVRKTPMLDWLVLTKRPEHILDGLPKDWGLGWANVWLGSTVESFEMQTRAEHLLRVPARVHWLSVEPQIDYVTIKEMRPRVHRELHRTAGPPPEDEADASLIVERDSKIDWIIVGGESGPKSQVRPFAMEWAESLRRECNERGIAYFMKQLGSAPMLLDVPYPATGKGDDPKEWPEHLRVREFPVLYNGAVVDSRSVVAKAARGEVKFRDGTEPGDDPMGSPVF